MAVLGIPTSTTLRTLVLPQVPLTVSPKVPPLVQPLQPILIMPQILPQVPPLLLPQNIRVYMMLFLCALGWGVEWELRIGISVVFQWTHSPSPPPPICCHHCRRFFLHFYMFTFLHFTFLLHSLTSVGCCWCSKIEFDFFLREKFSYFSRSVSCAKMFWIFSIYRGIFHHFLFIEETLPS